MDGYRGPAEEGSQVTLVCLPLLILAQNPELGRITVRGGEATLSVDYPRPMDSAVQTLVHKYGLPLSCEDPPYVYAAEMETIADVRFPVPKRHRFEAHFPAKPADIRSALQAVVDAANAQLPYAFRIQKFGDGWAVIPGKAPNRSGRVIDIVPLLDRKVSFPFATRSIHEHARLMADALSARTGYRVSCCQGIVGGIPWGMQQAPFGANGETARIVLRELMDLAGGNSFYLQRCDPVGPGRPSWCFIDVIGVSGTREVLR
jgi:hypothetical protein